MDKFTHLTADNMTKQEPGTLVSRFVGDVDTVETLFSSGIISMFADACRIISILVVIWFQTAVWQSYCRFAAVPVLLHAPRAEKYAGSAD